MCNQKFWYNGQQICHHDITITAENISSILMANCPQEMWESLLNQWHVQKAWPGCVAHHLPYKFDEDMVDHFNYGHEVCGITLYVTEKRDKTAGDERGIFLTFDSADDDIMFHARGSISKLDAIKQALLHPEMFNTDELKDICIKHGFEIEY